MLDFFFLCDELFSSYCFQNFIYVFQHFVYDVSGCGSLCIYPTWKCWASWTFNVFHKIWKAFSIISLDFVLVVVVHTCRGRGFPPLTFYYYEYVSALIDILHFSEALFFFLNYLSLFFRLHNLSWRIKFTDSFICQSNLLLKPSKHLVFVFFNSIFSIWFFLKIILISS